MWGLQHWCKTADSRRSGLEWAHQWGENPPHLHNLQHNLKGSFGTCLVVWWLRICLPMQETRVRALGWEDATCRGATKPVHHNYWACALEPTSHNYWACALEPASHNYWACALEPASHNYWSLHTQSPCSATREATAMRSPRTATKSSPPHHH